jgi:hypothetical protein
MTTEMPVHSKRRSDRPDGPPPRVFADVGVLLSRPERWHEWLSQHPDRAELFAEAFKCVVRLEAHTGWPVRKVLEELGCDTKTEDQLAALTEERLGTCSAYMRWVESLLNELDRKIDKRLAVSSAARFFVAANQELETCKTLMSRGPFPATDYLRLGEVAQAWDTAVRFLDGRQGERAQRAYEANPYMDATSPHLSPKRLAMLARPDAEQLLGPRIADRMHEHLELCPACKVASRGALDSAARDTAAELASVG